MDFLIVTALIFFLWLAAKKTKKLLRRLEPDEQHARREMIIIKADAPTSNTHLVDPPDAPAAEPELVAAGVADLPGAAPAAVEPWKEFTWEPSSEAAVGAR